jgi:hypothetical protein
MGDRPKYCPECGEKYRWYEAECPVCHVALVDVDPGSNADPDLQVVAVFRTDDSGLLPLATLTLEGEHIEYFVSGTGLMSGLPQQLFPSHHGDVPAEIFVGADNADKARELLADLATSAVGTQANSSAVAPSPVAAAPGSEVGTRTIQLQDDESGAPVGQITQQQLEFLTHRLEQESATDRDFYIDAATLDLLVDAHADARLVEILRSALGSRAGIEIRWSSS